MTSSPENKLTGSILSIDELTTEVRKQMFALMNQFYYADERTFFDDLEQKTDIILLHDEQSLLRGFTSAKLFNMMQNGEMVKILFSGDTIIHPEFWGTLELPRVWGRFMLDRLAEIGRQKLYWFLISSGYRTYRFLPAYFHDFFPRYDLETPEIMQKILDAAAEKMFGERYDRQAGIIRLENPTPLREIIAPPGEERCKNPHIDFFLKRNPGYDRGDELACITRLSLENIKPFVKRLLRT